MTPGPSKLSSKLILLKAIQDEIVSQFYDPDPTDPDPYDLDYDKVDWVGVIKDVGRRLAATDRLRGGGS